MTKQISAAFIIIGNEILSGRTVDANLNFIATELGKIGVNLAEARVVRDDEEQIISAIKQLCKAHDYVFTSGGIGPTHDDITAAAVAKAFDRKLSRDPRAYKILKNHYEPAMLNEARLKMADIPEGSDLLNNPVSSAPGFKIENLFVLAGVPSIMQSMFVAAKDFIKGGEKTLTKTISIYETEGNIAKELTILQDKHKNVEIGSYPFIKNKKLGTSLVFRGLDLNLIEEAYQKIRDIILERDIEILEEV
jgi:molybdenum cofactor synthesis domain-containing protein